MKNYVQQTFKHLIAQKAITPLGHFESHEGIMNEKKLKLNSFGWFACMYLWVSEV